MYDRVRYKLSETGCRTVPSDTSLIENATVFVVDDNPVNIELLIEYLQSFRLIVIPIRHSTELYKMLETTVPDLILLDIILPGDQNGYDICRTLKASEQTTQVPVIFMSSLSETEDKVKGFAVGGVDYVTKPVEPSELLSRVKAHLTIAELRNQLQTANGRLEEKVTERTAELRDRNSQLRSEIEKRKAIEADLIESLREKDTLLKEVHHRVKNNMQIVNSLFNLQVDSVVDPRDRQMFKDSQSRLYSMSLVYALLHQSDSLSRIRFDKYLHSLTEQLEFQYHSQSTLVDIRFDTDEIELEIDTAMPCALISNELITNALRHAYKDRERGVLEIGFTVVRHDRPDHDRSDTERTDRDHRNERRSRDGMEYRLRIRDDGPGLPQEIARFFDSSAESDEAGYLPMNLPDYLGFNLIQNLTMQIGARISYDPSLGADISLVFSP